METPEMPPLDQCEERAADDDANLQGAWWVATQTTVHLLTTMSRRDGTTGRGLPDSMRCMLRRLDDALTAEVRPLPKDVVFRAIELCEKSLGTLLMEPRTRLVRNHEMVPIHAAGEVDQKTMRWLGRLPGRTVREKLAGRDKIKAPKRRFTPDTPENRVVRRVLELFEEHVEDLDEFGEEDGEVADRFEAMQRLCGVELRNSPLSDVTPAVELRANNVMIDDRRYARVWRAAKLLRDRQDIVETNWHKMPDRARELVFWGLVARLVFTDGAVFWDRPGVIDFDGEGDADALSLEDLTGHVADGTSRVVELWMPPASRQSERDDELETGRIKFVTDSYGFIRRDDGGDVYFNDASMKDRTQFDQIEEGQCVEFQLGTPSEPGQSRPAKDMVVLNRGAPEDGGQIIRVALNGIRLSVEVATVADQGFVQRDGDTNSYDIAFDLSQELKTGRGMCCSIPMEVLGNRVERSCCVDPRGLRQLVDMIGSRLLEDVDAAGDSEGNETDQQSGQNPEESSEIAGIDFGRFRPWVATEHGAGSRVGGYAVGFDSDGKRRWRVETPASPTLGPGPQDEDASIREVFDTSGEEVSRKFSGVRHLVEQLTEEPTVNAASTVGYSVSDLADEEGKRRLRALMEGRLRPRKVLPIRRSVAAATGWQYGGDCPVDDEDQLVLVVDADAPQLTVTPMVSCRDDGLADAEPQTGGVYWERRPPLAVEDADDLLTSRRLMTDYAASLINETCGEVDPELVDYLVDSGRIEQLIEDGQMVVPVNDDTDRWLRLVHDATVWQECREKWFQLFDQQIAERLDAGVLDELREDYRLKAVLLAGIPFENFEDLAAWSTSLDIAAERASRTSGQIKIVKLEDNYGFIERPGSSVDDVFFHRGSVKNSNLFDELQRGTPVSFEVQQGEKGPEAVGLTTGLPAKMVTASDIGAGLVGLSRRASQHQITWAEWMPQLGIEVVRDGHFGVLPLLEESTMETSHTGRRETREVPTRLCLPADREQVLLPMLSGEKGRAVIGVQGRLSGGSLSMSGSEEVKLNFGFVPGVDEDWSITATSAAEREQGFRELSAGWLGHETPVKNARTKPPVPVFPEGRSSTSGEGEFSKASGLSKMLGRSRPETEPDDLLSCQDADELFDEIESSRENEEVAKKKLWNLDNVLGAGRGERAEYVRKTLELIRSFRSFEHFNPALLNATISGLGNALWDSEGLVEQLPRVDGEAVELLLDVSDKGLRNIGARLPRFADQILEDPAREQKDLKRKASPYRNICQLLMALLRLREEDFPQLLPENRRLGRMARYIRRIDAQLVDVDAIQIDRPFLRDILEANATVASHPPELNRVSQLGYQTGFFLLGQDPPLAEVVR